MAVLRRLINRANKHELVKVISNHFVMPVKQASVLIHRDSQDGGGGAC